MMRVFIKRYRKQNICVLFLTFVMTLIQTISAVIHTISTDSLIQGDVKRFVGWNLISLMMWGLLFIINYFAFAYEEKVIQLISSDIREHIVNKLAITSLQNVKMNNDGTYISWLNNDIQQIEMNGIGQYYALWGNVFSVGLSIVALVSYHYSLVLVTFLLMGLMMKFPSLFEQKMNRSTEHLAAANETFLSKIQDMISGYDIFYSFNIFTHMKRNIQKASYSLMNEKVQYVKTTKYAEGFIGFVNIFSQVGIVTVTGILAFFNVVTLGALSSTGSLASAIFNGVSQGSQNLMMFKTVEVYFDKYQEFEPKQAENNREISFTTAIELKNIHYAIAGKTILKDINFTFEKGKKYVVLGDSGSGKSTLLNIISGRIHDFDGSILVDNTRITDTKNLRNIIGYIAQQPHIFNATLNHNISLWRHLDLGVINTIASKLQLDSFATLDMMIEENGKNLSGGQKQRIAFARMLLNQHKVYLLDESTANLDKESAIMIENILLNDKDATVIMVTHHLYEENKDKFDDVLYL
ncbi:ABC transporter ATP-binding protein [Aerococcaceae bacterium zg-B36]|uniref:ATP-binding cassette domain-containing protein n=1 Tax=Aerococcaceae bacterium zg-252 TaxID=2796928 RepID=UPI001BD8268B|nr:ABC transporter ATP-binding protein [Aerococcaceae bacterium zg-B36]